VDETLTLIEKTAFLKSLPILASVPTEALAEIAARAREIHFDSGATIHSEGQSNRGAFAVLEGVVELRRGRALVRMISQGQAFGELFLSEGEPHRFTAIASNHVHVLNITADDTFDAMLEHPEFAVGMTRSLARRNLELVERLLELETLLGRFHTAMIEAGIEPPEAREREVAPSQG
jgi:CRP-like cAMP-binding protein